jgi:hypothetical protein
MTSILTKLGGAGGTPLGTALQTLSNTVGTIVSGISIGQFLMDHFGNETTDPIQARLAAIQNSLSVSQRSPADVVGVLDPNFSVSDTLLGQGGAAWSVAADRYVWTCTNPEVLTGGKLVGGVPYMKHRGYWAPLDLDLVGDYRSIVGIKHFFHVPGARLQGVLLGVEPHIEWSLEAFSYDFL